MLSQLYERSNYEHVYNRFLFVLGDLLSRDSKSDIYRQYHTPPTSDAGALGTRNQDKRLVICVCFTMCANVHAQHPVSP